MKYIP